MAEGRQRSIQEIESDWWGPPPEGATRLVSEVHRLRAVPVGLLTAEDLRLLLGQGEALPVVVPLAVEVLRGDPFEGGDLFRGALLKRVLGVPGQHWRSHPEQHAALAEVVDDLWQAVGAVADDVERFLDERWTHLS
ncbi:contact-dependent growth inhibition system immunity protein [Actinokineospora sp. G85]|uniref:contact-dependent growth inhibition system immunity protein n=1 Tax=Actinokineospora sp. G85 TaxID=3406626 RepID=UPI003C70911D